MKRAQDVRKQLVAIMDRYKMDIVSAGKNANKIKKCIVAGETSLHMTLARIIHVISCLYFCVSLMFLYELNLFAFDRVGYFTNAAKKDPQEGYKSLVEGHTIYIHPSSALFNKNPEW